MITFHNDCRPGEEPKYYTVTDNDLNFVYSNIEDMENWVEVMRLEGKKTLSGTWKNGFNFPKHEIKELHIEAGNRVPNKSY